MPTSTHLDPWPKLLTAVARAATVLGPAHERVCAFLRGLQAASGGFVGRNDKPDVYYACFATASLHALGGDWNRDALATWLQDHLPQVEDAAQFASWLRCRALLQPSHDVTLPLSLRRQLLGCAAGCRTQRKSLDPQQYFLAASAAGALEQELPERGRLATQLRQWLDEHPDTATGQLAAAAVLLHADAQTVPTWLIDRLHQRQIHGGWCANDLRPIPDLLDTAVAVHALRSINADLGVSEERVLDYVDSLWNSRGGFHGHWADDILDAEYTFYGLLTIGHCA